MADKTAIEWTDSTWNPVTGCTKISPGCDNCYAERFAERFRGVSGHPFENGFDLTPRPARLLQPLAWRQPRMIFVNSMSDLFHKEIPWEFVARVFETMERADWHVFQVLTKRSSRMRNFVNARYATRKAPAHIWFGTSIEDGTKLSRARHLRETAASVRFLSLEPLIGPIANLDLTGIHWVIVGGESGPNARPMHPDWTRALRDQCVAADVPFFFKQWGGLRPKSGGRSLDGREWSNWPLASNERIEARARYGAATA
jgi:protein gp37